MINGEIIAITGDGVNDASALKYANIGMQLENVGQRYQERRLILLENKLSTIVAL